MQHTNATLPGTVSTDCVNASRGLFEAVNRRDTVSTWTTSIYANNTLTLAVQTMQKTALMKYYSYTVGYMYSISKIPVQQFQFSALLL